MQINLVQCSLMIASQSESSSLSSFRVISFLGVPCYSSRLCLGQSATFFLNRSRQYLPEQKFMVQKILDFYDYRNISLFFSGSHCQWCPDSTVLRETREEKECFWIGFRKMFFDFIFPFICCGLETGLLVFCTFQMVIVASLTLKVFPYIK